MAAISTISEAAWDADVVVEKLVFTSKPWISLFFMLCSMAWENLGNTKSSHSLGEEIPFRRLSSWILISLVPVWLTKFDLNSSACWSTWWANPWRITVQRSSGENASGRWYAKAIMQAATKPCPPANTRFPSVMTDITSKSTLGTGCSG